MAKSQRFAIMMPPELHRAIADCAKSKKWDMAVLVREAVKEYLEREGYTITVVHPEAGGDMSQKE